MRAHATLICPHCGQTRALQSPDGLAAGLTLYVACPLCPGHARHTGMQPGAAHGTMHAIRAPHESTTTWQNAC